MYQTALCVRFVLLTAWFSAAGSSFVVVWRTLCWLWDRERTAELFLSIRAHYPNMAYFYALVVSALVLMVKFACYSLVGQYVLGELVFETSHIWFPYLAYAVLCIMQLQIMSYRQLQIGVRNWTVYQALYCFFLALFVCCRANAAFVLAQSGFLVLPSPVTEVFVRIWEFLASLFLCYGDSLKDIPMDQIGNRESIPNAVQIVRSLPFEIRVLLLTLGQTVYHNGKFPKSKKTIGFEFGLISAVFPHVCEGITADHLSDRYLTHNKQVRLIGALGKFYIVYRLFVLAVMETLVVGSRGSKTAPNRESCYGRVIPLFDTRVRATSTRSTFKLTGAGFLDFLESKKRRDRASRQKPTAPKTRRSRRKSRPAVTETPVESSLL